MIETTRFFLYRAARRLPHNAYATALFNRVNNVDGMSNLQNINLLDIQPSENEKLEDMDTGRIERYRDYRFLYLCLKSFRKFPPLDGDEFFGLSFCDGKLTPASTVIQGGNGTGKTTIFEAMETMFTDYNSAARKHGFVDGDGQKDYVAHVGQRYDDIKVWITTKSGNFHLNPRGGMQAKPLPICLLPFFCSEYDVDKFTQNGINAYIYEQVGYSSILAIIQKLETEVEWLTIEEEKRQDPEYEKREKESIDQEIKRLDTELSLFRIYSPAFVGLLYKAQKPEFKVEELSALKNELMTEINKSAIPDVRTWQEISEVLHKEKSMVEGLFGEETPLSGMYDKVLSLLEKRTTMTKDTNDLVAAKLLRRSFKSLEADLDLLMTHRRFVAMEMIPLVDTGDRDVSTALDRYQQQLSSLKEAMNKITQKERQDRRLSVILKNDGIYHYKEYLDVLKSEVYGTLDRITGDARNFVLEIMKLFLRDDEQITFDFNSRTGNYEFLLTIQDKESQPFVPAAYLNTFRYKLFCLTLKIAIAFSVMRFYKINFPIVLDDVFYSSDFVHRGMVREFFRRICKEHHALFSKEDKQLDWTLQIILLSHDDIVTEAARRGILAIQPTPVRRLIMVDYRETEEPESGKQISCQAEQPITVSFRSITL